MGVVAKGILLAAILGVVLIAAREAPEERVEEQDLY